MLLSLWGAMGVFHVREGVNWLLSDQMGSLLQGLVSRSPYLLALLPQFTDPFSLFLVVRCGHGQCYGLNVCVFPQIHVWRP